MHSLSTLLPLLASALGIAFANPVLNPNGIHPEYDSSALIHPRDEPFPGRAALACMYMTSGVNWTDEALNICQVAGRCSEQLPDGLAANVSSAGPVEGEMCFLYDQTQCTGNRSIPLVFPGHGDLATVRFANRALSWRCWKLCGYMGLGEPDEGAASTLAAVSGGSVVDEGPSGDADAMSNEKSLGGTSTTVPHIVSSMSKTLSGTTSESVAPAPPAISTTFSVMTTASGITMTITGAKAESSVTNLETFPTIEAPSTPVPSVTNATMTGIDTNTPGFSMWPSPVTLTHTFADGSVTVLTTGVLQPVPIVPTVRPTPPAEKKVQISTTMSGSQSASLEKKDEAEATVGEAIEKGEPSTTQL